MQGYSEQNYVSMWSDQGKIDIQQQHEVSVSGLRQNVQSGLDDIPHLLRFLRVGRQLLSYCKGINGFW